MIQCLMFAVLRVFEKVSVGIKKAPDWWQRVYIDLGVLGCLDYEP